MRCKCNNKTLTLSNERPGNPGLFAVEERGAEVEGWWRARGSATAAESPAGRRMGAMRIPQGARSHPRTPKRGRPRGRQGAVVDPRPAHADGRRFGRRLPLAPRESSHSACLACGRVTGRCAPDRTGPPPPVLCHRRPECLDLPGCAPPPAPAASLCSTTAPPPRPAIKAKSGLT